MQRTSAVPLALSWTGVIVYASLYPFSDWRDQGIAPWAFLWAPLPKYWTGFDLAINLIAYALQGLLVALALWRSGRSRHVMLVALAACATLSLVMETTQSYLPTRVPSNVDFLINSAGAGMGAAAAAGLARLGAVARWSSLRARWFVADARGALALLFLWPLALLFPAPVPLGLGQVLERMESALALAFAHTPFLDWLPVRDVEMQPLVPGAEFLCVLLGALIPCLIAFCIVRSRLRRALMVPLVLAVGTAASGLSAALSYGPQHAWDWLQVPVVEGLFAVPVLAVALLGLPRRMSAAIALLAMGVYLSLLNQAPADPYFTQTLQTWEQGRFIRLNGLAQWLGWLWPYAAVAYLLSQTWDVDGKN